MVLAGYGLHVSEADLRALCDCTSEGTSALLALDAARHFGFVNTSKQTLNLRELAALTNDGIYPIVFVSLRPIDGRRGAHALVVLEIGANFVTVYDPAQGERLIELETFRVAWRLHYNLAIIVEN